MGVLKGLLDMSLDDAERSGVRFTPREIWEQADYWADSLAKVRKHARTLQEFAAKLADNGTLILTGAGSSSFIGRALEGIFRQEWNCEVQAVPTTDILVQPDLYFSDQRPTLLVSFARSGNSPESVAVVELGRRLCSTLYNLIITCNAEGELCKQAETDIHDTALVVLDPAVNDKGLAMTSSFTNMLVAGQAVASVHCLDRYEKTLQTMISESSVQLDRGVELADSIAQKPFDRAIFLGNGSLNAIAEECALKLQELTDGTVMTAADSFLGFRHGPKAVLTQSTLLVYLVSNDKYTRKYERDLIEEIDAAGFCRWKAAIGCRAKDAGISGDHFVSLDELPDALSGPVVVIFGQLLALFKSLHLGLKPDEPSAKGAIHRVVQGVKIYPYPD